MNQPKIHAENRWLWVSALLALRKHEPGPDAGSSSPAPQNPGQNPNLSSAYGWYAGGGTVPVHGPDVS